MRLILVVQESDPGIFGDPVGDVDPIIHPEQVIHDRLRKFGQLSERLENRVHDIKPHVPAHRRSIAVVRLSLCAEKVSERVFDQTRAALFAVGEFGLLFCCRTYIQQQGFWRIGARLLFVDIHHPVPDHYDPRTCICWVHVLS